MARTFCLLSNKVDAFKKALKEKEIKISDLLNMSSEARIKLLEKYAGKNAADVNYLFEQKLVLKNKMLGIKNWASKVGEIGRYDPVKKAELIKMAEDYKKAQQERIFNPKEEETFLNNLADQAIGTHITKIEAKNIFDLSARVDSLREKFNAETGEWDSLQAKNEYGASKVILERYIDNLRGEGASLKDMLLERYYKGKETFKENKAKAVTDLLKDTMKTINDNAIAFVAAIDNSFIGRQGINTLMTRPSIWLDVAKKSFIDIYKSLKTKNGGKMAKDVLMTDVYSRPNYINGRYDLAKLLPRTEEQFPTTLPEKIPVIGRSFKASEVAFTNSAIRARTNLFDKIIEVAEKNEVKLDNTQIKDIGKLINSVTARGSLGRMGEGGVIRAVLWAPKMLKANWDVLTAHTGGAGLETPFARQQARINLLKIVSTTAGVAAMVNAIKPGSVETNPLSSDFMKIKVGNTRFDITGGKASIITLIARMIALESKSSTTGITRKLNTGEYGSKTFFDVGIDFLVNKTTPFAKAIIDMGRGRDFNGKKPTALSTAGKITLPISVQNFVQLFYGKNADSSVSAVLGAIADLFGINANTYSATEDWTLKNTKEMKQFKSDVSEDDFKKANKEYNNIISKEIDDLIKTEDYKKLSEDDKIKAIAKIKNDAKKEIFKKYNP